MAGTSDVRRPVVELSAEEARLIVLRAQGLLSWPSPRQAKVIDILNALGAVQLDTISVLARSHELVAYSRLGPVGRSEVESAYWGQRPATAFEYWAHAACVLPVEAWPYFSFRRRAELQTGRGWQRIPEPIIADVRARLKERPVTATELGGAKRSNRWFSRSLEKSAAEWLYWIGEAVCTDRQGWKRVYDLPERALPPAVLGTDPSDEECCRYLVPRAVAAMGIATRHDIADYYRMKLREVDIGLRDNDLVPVRVEGWDAVAWAAPDALPAGRPAQYRTTLLSPFDSLIWERKRMQRIFGFTMLLEAYRPKHERVHGYFNMPLLAEGRLVGHVDPAREGRTLIARQLSLSGPEHLPAMSGALLEVASWVGCDTAVVERTDPPEILAPLNRALGNPA